MKKLSNGIFTISLDFELHWGVMSHLSVEDYQDNLKGTKQAIIETLKLFESFEIHATWAIVGFLFMENHSTLLKTIPTEKPSYKKQNLNSYNLINKIGFNEKEDPYHFAPSIISHISNFPHQEIATHTFSHYFCLEDGQTIAQFEADIRAAIQIGTTAGYKIESIIFPRNQYKESHIEICRKLGILNVRVNQSSKIYHPRKKEDESIFVRMIRLADAYINITGYNNSIVSSNVDGLNKIPASRFLRPYSTKLAKLEKIRLNRIKNEMFYACKTDTIYHLWWHPHNLGMNTGENLKFLTEILKFYLMLNKEYKFQSLNMSEIGNILRH